MWSWDNLLIILTLYFLKKKRKISLQENMLAILILWDNLPWNNIFKGGKKLQLWLVFAVSFFFFHALFYWEFLSHEHLPPVDRLRSAGLLIPSIILECHTKPTLNKSTLEPQCKPSTVSNVLFPQFTMGNISVQTSRALDSRFRAPTWLTLCCVCSGSSNKWALCAIPWTY